MLNALNSSRGNALQIAQHVEANRFVSDTQKTVDIFHVCQQQLNLKNWSGKSAILIGSAIRSLKFAVSVQNANLWSFKNFPFFSIGFVYK